MDTEVRFHLAGGAQPLILVPVRVNDRGPYEFILDTGAGISLLSTELAESLEIPLTGTKEGMGAAGKVTVSLGVANSLSIGNCTLERVEVAITDELRRIGAVVGAHIDGNLGYNFLSRFRLEIDYPSFTLRLRGGSEPDTHNARYADLPFTLGHSAKPLILLPAFVNGEGPYRFAIDTGASTTVLSADLAQTLQLETTVVPHMTGAGGRVETAAAVVRSLAVGRAEIRNLSVAIAGFLAPLSAVIGTTLDGVIGHNFLKQFVVSIDYQNERLRLD